MTSLLIKTFAESFEGITDISEEEQSLIMGGDNCTYAGIGYSPGSNVTMPASGIGGTPKEVTKTCQENGTWK